MSTKTTTISSWTDFQPGDRIVVVRHRHTDGAFFATVEREVGTPTARAGVRALAEKQAAAYARMLELDGGVGLLGIREPEMFEDMQAWSNATENGHADLVLRLLDAIETLAGGAR